MPLLYCFSRFAALRQKNYTNIKTKNALFEPTNEEHLKKITKILTLLIT